MRRLGLLILGLAIACGIIFIVQNLQPSVQVYFLKQITLPIPLSLAILTAFGLGGLCALIFNQISFWLSPKYEDETDEPDEPSKRYAPPDDDDDDVIDVQYLDR